MQSLNGWTKSYCPYCGVGCGLLVQTQGGKVLKVKGDPSHPSSLGDVCSKPIYLPQVLHTPDRLLYPQIRARQDEAFTRVSWDSAFTHVGARLRQIIETYGADAVGFYGSGQFTTEDYYIANKFAKGFLGTNNFEANSRLCMASAVAGYMRALGADGPPPSYDDITLADCFLLIGTNTADCHPVVFQKIRRHKLANPDAVKVIVVDPRRTRTAAIADLYLPVRAGSDTALLNGILYVLIERRLIDEPFIAAHTRDFAQVAEAVRAYPPERAAAICGIEPQAIIEAALMIGQARAWLSFWSMGLNQSTNGVQKNQALINLHLATGQIGKAGAGPFSLTGQPNAMGGREAGGLAHLLPGYRQVANAAHREEVAAYWGVPVTQLSPKPGYGALEMFEAAADGALKALWIMCTNPMASMPNLNVVEAALRQAELVIVQDAYHPTDTTQYAHVLLPAAQWPEKSGVMTNSERRLTYVPQVVAPPAEALPDWQIVAGVARAMGFGAAFAHQSTEEVFAEFAALTAGRPCDYSGVNHARLQSEGPIQWPCPTLEHKGTPRLYVDQTFPTEDGRAHFHVAVYRDIEETTDAAFPLLLNTGRLRHQWHTMTRTGKSPQLMKEAPQPFVELHPEDAAQLGVGDGEMVEVASRRGRVRVVARVTDAVQVGTCFMPFHWGRLMHEGGAINDLTSDARDPIAKQPELKACAVRVVPVAALAMDESPVLAPMLAGD
ncbi:MAG: nitrate reductase [Chloroflexi bacterium]|nr:MAG: nitrate reductase [Chloroflexota bacterium]